MLERRWNERMPLNLPVDIAYAGSQLGGYRTRDIGVGGVFVEVPGEGILTVETTVELFFLINLGSRINEHRIKARVKRVVMDGIGMMFQDFDARAFRSLQEVLHYYQNNAN